MEGQASPMKDQAGFVFGSRAMSAVVGHSTVSFCRSIFVSCLEASYEDELWPASCCFWLGLRRNRMTFHASPETQQVVSGLEF